MKWTIKYKIKYFAVLVISAHLKAPECRKDFNFDLKLDAAETDLRFSGRWLQLRVAYKPNTSGPDSRHH